jgi:ABC-type antimicrobial peptide transport system permease subunit
MLRNYVKIAIRRFWRQKTFTLINVLGLSFGLAIALVMLVTVRFMLSFDSFHENTDNLYQVGLQYELEENTIKSYAGPAIWGQDLQNNYPEVIMNTRLMQTGEILFNTYDANGDIDKRYVESNGVGVDSTFFQMFSFPLLQGNLKDVLKDPNSIVLTKEFSNKYFGNKNPIGKTIVVNNKYSLKVSGVLADLPENTMFKYDYFFHVSFFENFGYDINDEMGNAFQIYILLENGATLDNIKSTFKDYVYERYDRDVDYIPFFIYVNDSFVHGESLNGIFMNIFAAIAIFILIMACINFMNLSTATSIQRSKEIAIRKIEGASRLQLVVQLLSESVLLALISLNVAVVIAEFIFEFLHRVSGQYIPFELSNPLLWAQLIILALITGLIAGSYPAIFLSSYKPIKALSFRASKAGAGRLRKILVVFQFVLSIIFLTSTIGVYRLSRAVNNNKIGVNTEDILCIPIKGKVSKKYELIKSELLQNSNILSVSASSEEPTWITSGEFLWGITPEKNEVLTRVLWADYDLFDVFDIKLKEGRYFSKDYQSDKENAVIVNEVIVDMLDLEDPVGKRFYHNEKPYTIIGVVEYFTFFPIEMGGRTLMIKYYKEEDLGKVYIKYKNETYPLISEFVQSVFEEHNPDYPYEYSFYENFKSPVDDGVDNLSKQLLFFTLFGLFIAILGLIGLAAFMVEQKTKEIGIRKAMGASVQKIISIITKQFFKLILIANLIALPISYLIGKYAIDFFTIKTNGDNLVYLGVFIFIFIVVFLIIYAVTIKAARTNPVQSLRYE